MSLYSRLVILCLSLIIHCKSVKITCGEPVVSQCTVVKEEGKGDKFIGEKGKSFREDTIILKENDKIRWGRKASVDGVEAWDNSFECMLGRRGRSKGKAVLVAPSADRRRWTDKLIASALNDKLDEIRDLRVMREKALSSGASAVIPKVMEWPRVDTAATGAIYRLERVKSDETSAAGGTETPMASMGTGPVVPGIAGPSTRSSSLSAGSAVSEPESLDIGSVQSAHENYYDLMDDYYYDLEVEEARQKRAMSRLQRQKRAISRLQRQRKHARTRKIAAKSRRFRYKSYN